jgi:hypothetical protein
MRYPSHFTLEATVPTCLATNQQCIRAIWSYAQVTERPEMSQKPLEDDGGAYGGGGGDANDSAAD